MVSRLCQLSRAFVSCAEQLGQQLGGVKPWRASWLSCASLGGGALGCKVGAGVLLQALASSAGTISVAARGSEGGLRFGADAVGGVTVFSFKGAQALGLCGCCLCGCCAFAGPGGLGAGVGGALGIQALALPGQGGGEQQGQGGGDAGHHAPAPGQPVLMS